MSTYLRDRDSVLDWRWDWSAWLAEGETISTAVVTVPVDLTKTQPDAHDDTTVTAWLSGGTAGETYTATARITTNQGRTDDRSIRLRTQER